MKTGALIRFACEAGAIVAGAPPADRERLAEFGSAIGLAFQLADDLLDLTADAKTDGQGDRQGRRPPARRRWWRCMAPPGRDSSSTGWSTRHMLCSTPMASARLLLKAAASFVAARRN